jgi:hypothetical protein
MKAFYLAESGIRYVDPPGSFPLEAAVSGANGCSNQKNPTLCLQNLASCINSPTTQCLSFNAAYQNPGYLRNTYSLDSGKATITIASSYVAGPPQAIRITSTAVLDPGKSGSSTQMITYNVAASATGASSYNDNFKNTANWTSVSGHLSKTRRFGRWRGPSFNAEAPKAAGRSAAALIVLTNSGQNLVNLTQNGLAGYGVQVKCDPPFFTNDYCMGISFQMNKTDPSAYGVSFFGGGFLAPRSPLALALAPLEGTQRPYIVLWKEDPAGAYTLLDYSPVTSSYGILQGPWFWPTLSPWSTLLVELQQYETAGHIKNEINVFVQGPQNYGPGTPVTWDLTQFNPVKWQCPGGSPVAATGYGISCGPSKVWMGDSGYNMLDIVVPTRPNGDYYECRSAGKSGGSEPAWPSAYHGMIADGTVQWMESGAFIDSSLTPAFPQIGLHVFYRSPAEMGYFTDFSVQGASSQGGGGTISY